MTNDDLQEVVSSVNESATEVEEISAAPAEVEEPVAAISEEAAVEVIAEEAQAETE